MRVVQFIPRDIGGIASVALQVSAGLSGRGHDSIIVCGVRHGCNAEMARLPAEGAPWLQRSASDLSRWIFARTPFLPGRERVRMMIEAAARPNMALERWRGIQDLGGASGYGLLAEMHQTDLLILHGLLPGALNLQLLPALSARTPVILGLHDQWLLTGHCAHPLSCERWRTGCGRCPDLNIFPAVRQDATSINLQRKSRIFASSRYSVVTPCDWLLQRANASIVRNGMVDSCAINPGVDLTLFKPGDKTLARQRADLPQSALIVLFAAFEARTNTFKDYGLFMNAFEGIAAATRIPTTFVALGGDGIDRQIGACRLVHRAYLHRRADIADYYRAADVYVHPAKAETFPISILEALASGLPVVASDVGGIYEQVRDVRTGPVEATGMVIDTARPAEFVHGVRDILANDDLRKRLGRNAAADAQLRFEQTRQNDIYVSWLEKVARRGITDFADPPAYRLPGVPGMAPEAEA